MKKIILVWTMFCALLSTEIQAETRMPIYDVEQNLSDANKKLFAAVKSGSLSYTEFALRERDVDPNARDADGRTPLYFAAGQGNIELVQTLIAAGATGRVRDLFGYLPAHWAAAAGHMQVFDFLRKDLYQRGGFPLRGNPLARAAFWANSEESFIKCESQESLDQELIDAIKRDCFEEEVVMIAKSLICGANPNAIDFDGRSVLDIAAGNLSVFTVQLLLDAGADDKVANENNQALVDFAKVADPSHVYPFDNLALAKQRSLYIPQKALSIWLMDLLVSTWIHEERIQRTLDLGASVHFHGGAKGNTPLHIAVEREFMPVIEMLLDHGAPVNAQDNDGDTPLHFALAKECRWSCYSENLMPISVLLLKKGASLKIENNHGETPVDRVYSKDQDLFVRKWGRQIKSEL